MKNTSIIRQDGAYDHLATLNSLLEVYGDIVQMFEGQDMAKVLCKKDIKSVLTIINEINAILLRAADKKKLWIQFTGCGEGPTGYSIADTDEDGDIDHEQAVDLGEPARLMSLRDIAEFDPSILGADLSECLRSMVPLSGNKTHRDIPPVIEPQSALARAAEL